MASCGKSARALTFETVCQVSSLHEIRVFVHILTLGSTYTGADSLRHRGQPSRTKSPDRLSQKCVYTKCTQRNVCVHSVYTKTNFSSIYGGDFLSLYIYQNYIVLIY